jgi:hypothetical protein
MNYNDWPPFSLRQLNIIAISERNKMAIATNPKRKTSSEEEESKAAAFIAKAGEQKTEGNRKPTMIRIPPDLLKRIDEGARRLGISRSAFIVQSAAEKLERMGS